MTDLGASQQDVLTSTYGPTRRPRRSEDQAAARKGAGEEVLAYLAGKRNPRHAILR